MSMQQTPPNSSSSGGGGGEVEVDIVVVKVDVETELSNNPPSPPPPQPRCSTCNALPASGWRVHCWAKTKAVAAATSGLALGLDLLLLLLIVLLEVVAKANSNTTVTIVKANRANNIIRGFYLFLQFKVQFIRRKRINRNAKKFFNKKSNKKADCSIFITFLGGFKLIINCFRWNGIVFFHNTYNLYLFRI
jgi:hypothetical protein